MRKTKRTRLKQMEKKKLRERKLSEPAATFVSLRQRENEARFRKNYSFLYTQGFKLLLFLSLCCIGFIVRLSTWTNGAYEKELFNSDDQFWHYYIVEEMVKLGYRPAVDFQSWAPQGRDMVHPPLFHYLVYAVWRLFPSFSAYQVMFWIGPFIGLLGIIAWFGLCRELYGSNLAGFVGSSIYAVLLGLAWETFLGSVTAQPLADVISVCALWSFYHAHRSDKKILLFLPGLLFGLATLTWESTLYFLLPLILLFWILSFFTKTASKKTHLLCFITLSLGVIIGLTWLGPIMLKYGVYPHANTPDYMIKATMTYWRMDLSTMLLAEVMNNNIFFLISLVAFPLLLLYVYAHRESVMKDFPAITWFTIGLAGIFFLGARAEHFVGFGILMVLTSCIVKAWSQIRASETRLVVGLILSALVASNAAYSFYQGASEIRPFYRDIFGVSDRVGKEIPLNSTILCWWPHSAFFLSRGLRTNWDQYMEHLPVWAGERGRQIASFYFANDEEQALKIAQELNVSYVFVHRYYAYSPDITSRMIEALGRNEPSELYFNYTAIKERKPILAKDPATGKPVNPPQVLGFEDVTVGYEFGPTEKGRNTLLADLIWNNQTRNTFKNLPMLTSPTHFQLVWENEDGISMLYKVIP